jgi:hypothetical protein
LLPLGWILSLPALLVEVDSCSSACLLRSWSEWLRELVQAIDEALRQRTQGAVLEHSEKSDVAAWGISGLLMLILSFVGHDPERTLTAVAKADRLHPWLVGGSDAFPSMETT